MNAQVAKFYLYFFVFSLGSHDSDDSKEDHLKTKRQEEQLMQFRQRKVNLLVGTFLLETDIDLPKCNMVAMFDPPTSYRSYIKTKVSGQGRMISQSK